MKPKKTLGGEQSEGNAAAQKDGGLAQEAPAAQVAEANSKEQMEAASGAEEASSAAAGAPAEAAHDVERLISERDRALAEKQELLDRFQRAQAEFENTRKRLLRETREAHEYAAIETIRSLLPIVDDFERALKTPGLDPDFQKGLELIHERMLDAFHRAGLRPVREEGKFDPHFHHAVDKAPAETEEQDETILSVYQRGYQFKDRLLRPAMVRVAVKE